MESIQEKSNNIERIQQAQKELGKLQKQVNSETATQYDIKETLISVMYDLEKYLGYEYSDKYET